MLVCTASSDTFYPGQERCDTVSGRITPAFCWFDERMAINGRAEHGMESATLFYYRLARLKGWRAA